MKMKDVEIRRETTSSMTLEKHNKTVEERRVSTKSTSEPPTTYSMECSLTWKANVTQLIKKFSAFYEKRK
jgi:hypothetical protein